MLIKAFLEMTTRSIKHEFEDMGVLLLESRKPVCADNDTTSEGYSVQANFEILNTGATYHAVFDDLMIRQFCTILSSDPDLLDDFLVVKPNIKMLPHTISAEFSSRLGSKTYSFTIQIPKFTPEGSLAEVAELCQKNNVLVRRIQTLEQRLTEQEKNIVMLTYLHFSLILRCYHYHADEYLPRCIDIVGEMEHNFDIMINNIKTHDSVVGTHLLEMIKVGKLPKLKECLIDKKKEMYICLIGTNINKINYIDRILQFCQLEIEIDYDTMCIGKALFESRYGTKNIVEFTIIEYFNQSIHRILEWKFNCTPDYQVFIKFPDFSQKCNEVRRLLIKLSGK
jgi:hypothetical protein